MKLWILFIILYGILKGAREPIKKAIVSDVNVLSALFGYTFIGFLIAIPFAKGIFSFPPTMFFLIILKSLAVFVAWILSFKGIKKIPVSVYGVVDMSRVIFSTLLGILFLHEDVTVKGIVSLLLVATGLYFANQKQQAIQEEYSMKYVWYVFLSCFFNGISGILDKYIMSSGEITSSALQFWFMLFLSLSYFVYMCLIKEKPQLKKIFTNPWVYVLGFSLVLGDRLVFVANADHQSKVTIMTILKQSSAVVTILLGKLCYKEKNILRKLVCASVIIAGICLSVL